MLAFNIIQLNKVDIGKYLTKSLAYYIYSFYFYHYVQLVS